jgi:hypothetical protein
MQRVNLDTFDERITEPVDAEIGSRCSPSSGSRRASSISSNWQA